MLLNEIIFLMSFSLFLQMVIQSLLVVIALACVPCMLVVKTMVLRRQYLWKKHLVRAYSQFNICITHSFGIFASSHEVIQ